jgi:hypothetical protein
VNQGPKGHDQRHQEGRESDRWSGLTLEEVRARMAVAAIEIVEARLELVRGLLNMALAPIHAARRRDPVEVEPAFRFDAAPTRPDSAR